MPFSVSCLFLFFSSSLLTYRYEVYIMNGYNNQSLFGGTTTDVRLYLKTTDLCPKRWGEAQFDRALQ